jgi:AcrR family transcriptional regulator
MTATPDLAEPRAPRRYAAPVVDDEERVLTRQGRDRKAHLLKHAEQLFMEKGYADTRMVDIAAAAGVAKGLVYWYFDSKEALFRDIIQHVRTQLRSAQAEALEGVSEPLDRIYIGTRTSVVHVAEHWKVYFRLQAVDPSFERELSESSRLHAEDAVAMIVAGQADGTIRADEEPVTLAQATQGVANQAAVAFLRGRVTPLEAAADSAARFVVRAVASATEVADAVIARHRTS